MAGNSLLNSNKKRYPGKIILLGFFLFLILPGCSAPPLPMEVGQAESLSHNLWKARVPLYAPEEYKAYEADLRRIKDDLIKEKTRFIWFRDYQSVAARLQSLLKYGEGILTRVEGLKESKRTEITGQLAELESRIRDLDRLSQTINEGRLVRRSLMKAGMTVHEAGLFLGNGDFDQADSRLRTASGYIKETEDGLFPILNRYSNTTVIARWRQWANEAVAESRENGGIAIVVSKMDRSMTLYKAGKPYKRYGVGLGRNGFQDKLHGGDGATPEGRYRIIRKLDRSKYYKALLLNYPNDEDKREFIRLKKKGIIPGRASIGGLIEIHGSGKDGMTYGCVSLDNEDMDEVFRIATPGTPVAIVGATNHKAMF